MSLMLKRLLSLLLVLCLVMSCASALADTQPRPISVVDYDTLPGDSNGQHHYLLLCEDNWTHNSNSWTDGIVLVTLDTRTHRVLFTSIIREALVLRPDGVIGRINGIMKRFSLQDMCRVVSTHLGVKVEKYILFTFSHIQSIIDHLGGVDITINAAEANYLTRYAISKTSTTPSVRGAGTYHFGGHAAVIYMRIRKAGGGGDFMRTQRVRTVLSTLTDQCRTMTEQEARTLVDVVLENSAVTNMSLEDMVQAMEYALELRDCTIEELRIPQDGDHWGITYAGMSVHEVDWEASREKMADFLQNSFLVVDDEDEEE